MPTWHGHCRESERRAEGRAALASQKAPVERGEHPFASLGGSSTWRNKKQFKALPPDRQPELGSTALGGGHGEREAGPQCEWRASPRVRAAGNQGRGTGTEPCLPWTGLMGHATRSFTQAAGRRVCECAGTRGETRSWRDLGAQGRSHGLCMASQRPPGRGPPWSQGAAVA